MVGVTDRGTSPCPAPSEGRHPARPASTSAKQTAVVPAVEVKRGRGQVRVRMLPAGMLLALTIS
jgi:hypothetical protein